jgi:hypothetical protein
MNWSSQNTMIIKIILNKYKNYGDLNLIIDINNTIIFSNSNNSD